MLQAEIYLPSSDSPNGTVSRLNRVEQVQRYLTRLIVKKGLKPGDPLPTQSELADELGIGISSVREGFKILQALGFVEIRHGAGAYVREYNFEPFLEMLTYGLLWNPATLSELVRIRAWLESALVDEVATRITADRIRQLEAVLDSWAEAVEAGESFAKYDREFHRTLYESLCNRTLLELWDVFWTACQNVHIVGIDVVREEPAITLQEHQDILEAVRANDAERARSCMLQSFSRLRKQIDGMLTDL